jgi:arylsulfatase A-like enzyme
MLGRLQHPHGQPIETPIVEIPMSERPNFILFITDQHRADFLGCYGHPVLRTPNIDSIAMRGTVFDRFYVASPVCMPNRASLMTGRMPSVHGVRSNGIPLSMNAVTFADLLREVGYRTALVGKSHLQNFTSWPPLIKRPPPRQGYQEPSPRLAQALRNDLSEPRYGQETPEYWNVIDAGVQTPFYGFDHVTLVRAHGDEAGGDYDRWLAERDPKAAQTLLGSKNRLPHDYSCPQAYRTAIPAELYVTAFLAERACAYLEAAAPAAPFFLMVSFPDPHHPFNPPGKYWDMYKPEQFPVPEAYLRNDWAPPALIRAIIEERETGKANLAGMSTIAVSAREAQEARALTCGMIACIDDAIGTVLRALDRSGRRNDTVLIFTSDHGDHLGDHRLMLKGAEQYRSIVQVPFIWSDPQGSARPCSNALASTIDISATVLNRARIEPFSGMQGRSLLPAMEHGAAIRDSVFVQYDHQVPSPGTNVPPRVHSLIDERYRLSVFHGTGWGELYDLADDPGEFNNLWDDAAHAGTRAHMVERLLLTEIDHVDRIPLPTRRA